MEPLPLPCFVEDTPKVWNSRKALPRRCKIYHAKTSQRCTKKNSPARSPESRCTSLGIDIVPLLESMVPQYDITLDEFRSCIRFYEFPGRKVGFLLPCWSTRDMCGILVSNLAAYKPRHCKACQYTVKKNIYRHVRIYTYVPSVRSQGHKSCALKLGKIRGIVKQPNWYVAAAISTYPKNNKNINVCQCHLTGLKYPCTVMNSLNHQILEMIGKTPTTV